MAEPKQPRSEPHPLALFSLAPLNQRAWQALEHASNRHLVSAFCGSFVLNVGHVRSRQGDGTLATLGRNGDITVMGSTIAKLQCSFEVDAGRNVVSLYDRSHGGTSQFLGPDAVPFQPGRPREVVVCNDVNTILSLGGSEGERVQFRLIWHISNDAIPKKLKDRRNEALQDDPRFAKTAEYTDGEKQPRFKTVGKPLGSGKFGTVYKAVDLDSGAYMAVKMMTLPAQARATGWTKLKREVEILARVQHKHIVEYISSYGWDGPNVNIFMALKDGSLQSLLSNEPGAPVAQIAETVLHQMLQAIDCLAVQGIVHRDVKPENILYVKRQADFHFQLGDFGLSNRQSLAESINTGTPLYMAPEMLRRGEQTHKVDVWSLFVTMLWIMDVHGFRGAHTRLHCTSEVTKFVMKAAQSSQVPSGIRPMASLEPRERASAADMLDALYHGQGRVTKRCDAPH